MSMQDQDGLREAVFGSSSSSRKKKAKKPRIKRPVYNPFDEDGDIVDVVGQESGGEMNDLVRVSSTSLQHRRKEAMVAMGPAPPPTPSSSRHPEPEVKLVTKISQAKTQQQQQFPWNDFLFKCRLACESSLLLLVPFGLPAYCAPLMTLPRC
jgi:hypothetical protein